MMTRAHVTAGAAVLSVVALTGSSAAAATQDVTVPAVICNTAADVIAMSARGSAKSAAKTAPSGFTNSVDYVGTASFGGVTATINSAAGAANGKASATTANAAKGTLVITNTPVQPSVLPMPATSCTDTLRVMLVPR